MEKNHLLIIDLEKNLDQTFYNKNYVYLNRGNINLKNCKQIRLKNFSNSRKVFYQELIKKFRKFILVNKKNKFFYSEMEIFNLRNDRYSFPDRILNFLTLKKIIFEKKIKFIEIISDNKNTLKIFDNFNLKIKRHDFSFNKSKSKLKFTGLKIIKFFIKAFLLVLILKLQKKYTKKIKKKGNYFISLYPNNFSYGKKFFFKEDRNICNFLLSDETHLNFSFKKLLFYLKITKDKKIINLEQFINISDFFLLFLKQFNYFLTIKNTKKINFNIQELDFKDEINEFYINSYINRSKLDIYSKALPRFLKEYNVSSINIYLFEYSFGFFLIRNLKQFSKKIKITGFQHGVFSDNLMWFDVLNTLDHKKFYIPNKIFCLNKYTLKDYRLKYKDVEINILKENKNNKKTNFINDIKIDKNSNKILVLTGLHDVKDLYYYIKNSCNNDNKIYYLKLHPKSKYNFTQEKKIKKINNFKQFSFADVIVSQNSSLPYDFLSSNRCFSSVDFDYKQNYISSSLNKNKKINFLK